jgi:hypothetical protein
MSLPRVGLAKVERVRTIAIRPPMAVTRNIPGPEGRAALRNLLRAAACAAIAQGLYYYAYRIDRLIPQTLPKTWRGFLVADVGAAVVGAIGLFFLVVAIRRIGRWLIALKHQRMLKDPVRAALVPPLPSHLESLDLTKTRQLLWNVSGVLLFGSLVVLASTLLYLGVNVEGNDDEFPVYELLAAALFMLGGSMRALWKAVRRFANERRVQRASRDPRQTTSTVTEQSSHRAEWIPRLAISAPVCPPLDRTLQEITVDRNIFGRRPWNIAYLRLFDNEKGLQEFLAGAWREFGYVHLIKDADSVSPDEAQAMARGSDVFINSRTRLLEELAARPLQPLSPGRHELAYFAADPVKVSDRYGSYPVRALLCHETFWKSAVDVLLERADLVLIDLHGYHWNNTGTAYELQRVVDRFPIERCVVLAAASSDMAFLEAQIQRAWSQMARGSPNEGRQSREVLMVQQSEHSRALAALIQRRIDVKASAELNA